METEEKGTEGGEEGVGWNEESGSKWGEGWVGCYGFQVTRGVEELGSGEVEHG